MNLFSGDIPVFCKAFFLLGAKALAVAFILGLWAPQTRAEPDVVGKAALLMELHTGKIVWTKNENERLAPASTTKILTALVALERSPLQQIVAVSDRAAATEGSSMYLRPGERASLEELLYAALLGSGNDAAIAIAEGGSRVNRGIRQSDERNGAEARSQRFQFSQPSRSAPKGSLHNGKGLSAHHMGCYAEPEIPGDCGYSNPSLERRGVERDARQSQ